MNQTGVRFCPRLFAALLIVTLPAAAERDAVTGYWSTGDSIFEIYEQDGTLLGQIRALRSPVYEPGEREGYAGKPRVDSENPDPELRGRPLLGLHMFSDYAYEDGLWQGSIYDPETGNTYQSRMKVNRRGELEIRGYIGMPMFGRTATFQPASRCTDDIIELLDQLPSPPAC